MISHGMAGRGKARFGGARRATAWSGWAWHGFHQVEQGWTGCGRARPAEARRGGARQGFHPSRTGLGPAWLGAARHGSAWLGMGFHQVEQGQVRPGLAWSGTASPGRAWQGIHQVEQGKPGLGAARSGQGWLGLAWEVPHKVEQGEAGTGEPRHGGASRGPARQGMGFTKVEQAGARPGVAGPGLAWHGQHPHERTLPHHRGRRTMEPHNVNGPGGAQTPPDPTGSPMEAPDGFRRYARTPGIVNA